MAKKIHPDVIKLGIVSFLTDLSSEMIFSVFAIFFTGIAGASAALLGLVEGLADLASASLNYFSGRISDKTGKRKIFAVAGYGFSTLAKLILVISTSVLSLSIFRVIERLGKSFRGAPRDAWLADLTHHQNRGYSFGIHKALDKSGAILGPLVAYGLITFLGNNPQSFKILFVVALIPALLSVVVLTKIKDQPCVKSERISIVAAWSKLSDQYKQYLLISTIFSLAYFSFSFLLLKAYALGFSLKDVILLYATFNISCALCSPGIGKLSDYLGREHIIMLSYAIYIAICLGFIFANTQWHIVCLFVLFGIFYAIDEAQNKAFVADLETKRRGSAMGLYSFCTGVAYLPASLIAGSLWLINPNYAFIFSGIFAFIALILLKHFNQIWRLKNEPQ